MKSASCLFILLIALALPSAASADCTGKFAFLAHYAGGYKDKFLQEAVVRSRMRDLMGSELGRLEADLDVSGPVALIDCELVVEGNARHLGGLRNAILSFNIHTGHMTVGVLDQGRVTIATTMPPSTVLDGVVYERLYDHLPAHVRDWAFVAADGFRSRGRPPPNVVVSSPKRP
jgi:hypothetical protein